MELAMTLGIWLQAGVTIVIAAVAYWQLISVRRDQKTWRTLEAVSRYDTDPVLDTSLRNIREAVLAKGIEPRHKPDVATVLNYLDGIATGIEQRLYVDALAKDHLKDVVRHHVDVLLADDVLRAVELERSAFDNLTAMCERWTKRSPEYRDS